MPAILKANEVLIDALVDELDNEGLKIKHKAVRTVCAEHIHNLLSIEKLVDVYSCKRSQAERIMTVLNNIVPRDSSKGAMKMSAKKTAAKKPAAKKTATDAPKKEVAKKEKVLKAPQVKENGVAQPREGTTTRKVWEGLDKMKKELRRAPTRKEATAELAKSETRPDGFHKGTIGVQYRNWAIFHDCYTKAPKVVKAPKAPKAELPTKAPSKRPLAKKVLKKGAKAAE